MSVQPKTRKQLVFWILLILCWANLIFFSGRFGKIAALVTGAVIVVVGLVVWIANKSTASDERKLN